MKDKLVIILIIILFSFNFITAEIISGNSSGEIQTFYGTGDSISGWINISVTNEANSSFLNTYFNSNSGNNINIQRLLNSNGLFNGAGYSCLPVDCSENFTTTGDSTSKTVTINRGYSKILGIKITSNEMVDSIRSLEFDVSANGGNSCYVIPLGIDILNEGTFEYSAENLSNELCTIKKPYGCFDSSDSENYTELEEGIAYCEKIEISPYKSYLIGANISSTADFSKAVKITMDAGCGEKICIGNVSSNSIKCNITLDCDLQSNANATVCIKPQQATPYRIRYERTNPVCGHLTDDGADYAKDFEIFAYPIKYKAAGSFRFNKSMINMDSLSASIKDNLLNRYLANGTSGINCTKGCVVPIKFFSGIDNQQITISNIKLNYTEGGIKSTATLIGDLVSSPPIITVMNPSKLDLDDIGILTPNSVGKYIFSIKHGIKEIFKTNITVTDVAEISNIIPTDAVALVDNTFFAIFNKPMTKNANYIWKFGDADPINTTEPTVKYKFNNVGEVTLGVTLSTNDGESTKFVTIQVYTPDKGFNKTVKDYREKLANFSSQLNTMGINDFAKNEINSIVKPLDLKMETDEKERTYLGYLDSQEAEKLGVMRELLAMKIPSRLDASQTIKNSKYLHSSEKISFEKLEEFEAGTIDGDAEDFKKKIASWINNNLNISFESKSYRVSYSTGEKRVLFSDMVFTLTPKEDIPELFFIIDSPSIADKIKVSNGELRTKESSDNNAYLISLRDLTRDESTRIEFLYPAEVSIANPPVYVSPILTSVGGNIQIDTSKCNNNGKCDGKEDYKTCPGDCKPWKLAGIFMGILLFVALIIYILMQEWYKRHYESYLFTNKIQLYNLINFMYNSSSQGTSKSEIFSKLKDREWSGEQLSYAWKKFRGQRVGMWEIPVFKWVENRQVKKELIKRNPGLKKENAL